MFTSAFRMSMTASTGVSYETEASTYFAAIATAGSTITTANKAAVNAFIAGCKADGIWTAIKASCLLAGPDSLAGALVPLVGTAPTNNGPFVPGDYSRTTGLIGDGATKYLNSNRNNNADTQNNQHLAVYVKSRGAGPAAEAHAASGFADAGSTQLWSRVINSDSGARCQSSTFNGGRALLSATNVFQGISRSGPSEYSYRANGTTSPVPQASSDPVAKTMIIFGALNGASPASLTTSRLSFYSIGESLNLALLNARLTTYMAALT